MWKSTNFLWSCSVANCQSLPEGINQPEDGSTVPSPKPGRWVRSAPHSCLVVWEPAVMAARSRKVNLGWWNLKRDPNALPISWIHPVWNIRVSVSSFVLRGLNVEKMGDDMGLEKIRYGSSFEDLNPNVVSFCSILVLTLRFWKYKIVIHTHMLLLTIRWCLLNFCLEFHPIAMVDSHSPGTFCRSTIVVANGHDYFSTQKNGRPQSSAIPESPCWTMLNVPSGNSLLHKMPIEMVDLAYLPIKNSQKWWSSIGMWKFTEGIFPSHFSFYLHSSNIHQLGKDLPRTWGSYRTLSEVSSCGWGVQTNIAIEVVALQRS